jgi:transcriptional regulator with XRE-family HTH domain
MLAGEHPLRLWRASRAFGADACQASGADPRAVPEIESGKKPGSLSALKALASALDIAADLVLPWRGRSSKGGERPAARRRGLPQLSIKG